jgi:CubicO group peptidase (beta-lactamase class C family)
MSHTQTIRITVLLVLAFISATSLAQTKPTTKPESVGMSTERLKRIHESLQRHIDAGDITGAVTAVARRGQVVHFEAHGFFDVEKQTPMTKDALFRMASSSKPVTGVAVMMLVEEGKIRLTDPVSLYIPEFKNLKVAVPKPGQAEVIPRGPNAPKPEADLVSAKREITIEDLMTHTSGLQSGGLGAAVAPLERSPNDTLATYIPKLGATVLDFQPGTRWSYSALAGIDTLGRIVEIVSGMSFDDYLRERIFKPLGMTRTFFNVPDADKSHVPPLFRKNASGWQKYEAQLAFTTGAEGKYYSGAAGLVSSAEDYLHFEQMLLNRGVLNGHRLLGTRTVELMGMNHVGDLYHSIRGNVEGVGFGLTMYVTLDEARATPWRGEGSFGWSGAFGTISWNDKKDDLVAVLMIQQGNPQVQADFQTAVMQAIAD